MMLSICSLPVFEKLRFAASPLPKSAQKIPWKFCEIATIQMTDFVIKCK